MSSKSYKSLDPKRSLGQNFLSDPWWIQRIVNAFGLEPEDTVLEIGPGKGVLTNELLKVAGRLIAVEIDQRMVEHLGERFAGAANLEIVHEDFLKYPLAESLPGVPVRIIGNLPYHITSGIIGRVLDEIRASQADPANHPRVTSFDIMIQKEVGDRICSSHGSKVYGVLSVLAFLLCDVRILLDVPPNAFYPRPKVTSSVLRFRPLPAPRYRIVDWELFRKIVRAAFNQRRKMLRNSLQAVADLLPEGYLARTDTGLLERRPEQLSPLDFITLANTIAESRPGVGGPP